MLNLINRLPSHSHFSTAYANDDEIMEIAAAHYRETGEKWVPPQTTWTPEVDMLAKAIDAINRVFTAIVATNGGKPPTMTPTPRPTNRFEAARSRLKWAKHQRVVDMMLPHNE